MVWSAGEKLMQTGRDTVFPYQESILRRREVGDLMRRGIHLRMVRHVVLLAVVALSAFVVVVFINANGGATATLRSDFDDRSVTPIFSPIDLAFAPDGRMLIATQPGLLRVYEDGELLQAPALDLTGKLCSNSERGLLGVALDPSFSTNRFVYLYYTFDKFGECPVYDTHNPNNPVNRVSRFVMSGDTIDPSSEKVLIDNIPSPSRHNSGDLNFGKNGYLYVSVGDGGATTRRLGLPDQQRRLPRPARPLGQGTAHNPRRRHTLDQPLHGNRQRPLQRYRPHRSRQEVPGDVRFGVDATPSASPSTRTPRAPASSSVTSAMKAGRRSTWARRGPTTPGTSARATTTTAPARAL